jgi:hypothetical protein
MATTQTTGKRRDWVMRIVLAAIIATGVLATLAGRSLYQADVIGIVPLGTESSVYVGPCTVQPLQLTGTCRTEVAR